MNVMKILPEEIPSDALPLNQESEIPTSPPFPRDILRDLNGKNVFVNLNRGRSAVGHLNVEGKLFSVGTSDEYYSFDEVESFREV
jgi:hypothetical protein